MFFQFWLLKTTYFRRVDGNNDLVDINVYYAHGLEFNKYPLTLDLHRIQNKIMLNEYDSYHHIIWTTFPFKTTILSYYHNHNDAMQSEQNNGPNPLSLFLCPGILEFWVDELETVIDAAFQFSCEHMFRPRTISSRTLKHFDSSILFQLNL